MASSPHSGDKRKQPMGSHQETKANDPMSIEEITLDTNSQIKKYLERDVEPVTLPKILENGIEMTYPPLILDGASGVGKTQQAFALLKKEKSLVYLLLSVPSQDIYNEMDDLCNFWEFDKMYDGYVESISTRSNIGIDFFSTKQLKNELKEGNLNDFLQWFVEKTLFYSLEQNNDGTEKHVLFNKKISGGMQLEKELKNRVLFIDEALPHNCELLKYKNRLRFVRNLGRILKMRVVPAGTSAVVANMLLDGKRDSGGRYGAASRSNIDKSSRWAMCNFLWKPMKESEFEKLENAISSEFPNTNGESLQKALQLERPLFIHLLTQKIFGSNIDICKLLKEVGRKMCNDKSLQKDFELMTLWLSGACLAKRNNWTSLQHKIKSSQLVCGHFFEPAMTLAVSEKGKGIFHNGIAQLSTFPGPLEATVCHIDKGDTNDKKGPMWVLCVNSKGENPRENEVAMATEDFDEVKAALSSCVQQCLAREPLLAIALSLQHRFSAENFKKGLKCFRESLAEQNLSAIGGKQLELITFAALQLSNGNNMEKTTTVDVFRENLARYLSSNAFTQSNFVNPQVLRSWDIPDIFNLAEQFDMEETGYGCDGAKDDAKRLRAKKNAVQGAEDDSDIPNVIIADATIEKATVIPWLVPAHSLTGLQESCLQAHRELFRDKNIAALIPGSTNDAHCDIDAYKWPLVEDKEPELLWKFVVNQGQIDDYSMEQGIKDLVAKCEDDSSKTGLHHAMLIAARRQPKTMSRVWQIEKGEKKYLRIVLLVSGL